MHLGWKLLVPVALLNIIVTGGIKRRWGIRFRIGFLNILRILCSSWQVVLKSRFSKGGFRGNAVHLKGGGQNVGRALPAKILKTNSRGRLFYIILP